MSSLLKQGKRITWTNGGSAVLSGAPVVLGNLVFIALVDIGAGETGELGIGEVYRMPKVTGAVIAQGATVHFDVSEGKFDDNLLSQNDGDILGGAIAWEAAGDGDTEVDVYLSPKGGTIGVTPP